MRLRSVVMGAMIDGSDVSAADDGGEGEGDVVM